MAQDLPFSIANILRSDFPHPSRINKAPNILPHVAPLRGTGKVPFVALRCQLDRRIKSCSETPGFFSYSAPTIRSRPDKDDYQNPKTEQRPKRSTEISSEDKSSGNKTDESGEGTKQRGEKSATKKKRNRSHFTQVQLKYLEDVFSRQQYLTRDERALLANALNMTELQIRNWFQNRRYQLRHRGINRPRQVPVKVLVSSSTLQASDDP